MIFLSDAIDMYDGYVYKMKKDGETIRKETNTWESNTYDSDYLLFACLGAS